jgi:hypothetical protein
MAESSSHVNRHDKKQISMLSDGFHKLLQKTCNECALPIVVIEYVGLHGPASKLKLKIGRGIHSEGQIVHVDISVACRVKLRDNLLNTLNVHFDEWEDIIRQTGSFLLMKIYQSGHPKYKTSVGITITESEKHYMLTCMSEHHKRVYRLLKLLINGNEGNDELRRLVRQPTNNTPFWGPRTKIVGPKIVCDIPSYAIKCLMFSHAQFCRDGTRSVAGCVVQVMGTLLKSFQIELDRCSHLYSEGICARKFSVRVEKVFGDSLEITDEYESSADIAETLCNKINALKGDTQIENTEMPLTEQAVDHVKAILQKQKENFACPSKYVRITIFVSLILIVVTQVSHLVLKNHTKNVCADSSNQNRTVATLNCFSYNENNSSDENEICSRYYCELFSTQDTPDEVRFAIYRSNYYTPL